MNVVRTLVRTAGTGVVALRRRLGNVCKAWLALAAIGLVASATSAPAVAPSDAPGYGLAPVCAMADCEGDFPESGVPILNTAGAGQGARIGSGASRPVSLRLSDGSYQCRRVINNCGGDVFIPANSPTEWNSFVNGHPSCIGIVPCSYREALGPWAGWTASCGPAVRQRWIGCQRDDTHYVSASFCSGRTLDQEASCFPCPTTSCSPASDGGVICTTDDRCGTVSSTYTPPTTQGQRCPDGTIMPSNGVCSTGPTGICPDGTPMPSNGVCSPPPSSGACVGSFFVPGPGMVPINMVDKQFFWYATGNVQDSGSGSDWYGDVVQCNNGTASVIATGIGENNQETFRSADRPWDPGSKQGCSGITSAQVTGSNGESHTVPVPYSTSHGGFVPSVGTTYMCWNGFLVVFGT